MKKILILALVLMLALFTFASCTQDNNDLGDGDNTNQGGDGNSTDDGGNDSTNQGGSDSKESITVYFKNNTGWQTPYFHAWNSTGAINSWPGVPMTKVEGSEDWYFITAEVDSLEGLGYLFCDGTGQGSAATGNQTSDIVYSPTKLYYADGNLYASAEDAESDSTEYVDLYIRGSHNNWGTDSRFTLDENGNSVITVTLSAGVQFKIANGDWSYDINYTDSAFQADSNFDWGTDNNNVKVVNAGSYTFTVTAEGTLTITKN